ncbi:hypothetical protein LRP88_11561 [Fusarium phalaenopsidis]
MSFANSSIFSSQPAGEYTPFQPVSEVRGLVDGSVKVCLAIGGWGDNAGFSEAVKTDGSRHNFARNVASTLDRLGFDCADIDWEYPGGNGEDYKRVPNQSKASEIDAFPRLLQEVKAAIGDKELSIAVPGLRRDMIAFTPRQVPKINQAVDFVNVMTYDLMNRRDEHTTHQTSIQATLLAIDRYIDLGFPAFKLAVGFPFYAKWFTTQEGYTCEEPVGCPVELLENPEDGSDTGKSGSMTFEEANFVSPPESLMISPDQTCGAGTSFKCPDGLCCSSAGYCGTTDAHCTGCQSAYGRCEGPDLYSSFHKALEQGRTDEDAGAQWYWDADDRIFWSWDTPELISQEITTLAKSRGVRSIMAWSLGLDGHDWRHLKAMQEWFDE